LLTLQGCGQKKPLTLPEQPQQNTTSQTSPSPTQETQEGKQ
jgi:predicted small lipoprotein YifL